MNNRIRILPDPDREPPRGMDHPDSVFPDDRTENLVEETALIRAIRVAYTAAKAALHAHNVAYDGVDDCDCHLCADFAAMIWQLNVFDSMLTCNLFQLPGEESLAQAVQDALAASDSYPDDDLDDDEPEPDVIAF